MPSMTLQIKMQSRQERSLLTAIQERVDASKKHFKRRHEAWRRAEQEAMAYLPETEFNLYGRRNNDQSILRRQHRANLEAKSTAYTPIKIPYSYGILMASHTYWANVFLSRNPIFQFTGRHGESQQQTQALEALIAYQVQVGEMLVPLYLWLLDAGKYGLGIVSVNWANEQSSVARIVEGEAQGPFAFLRTGRSKRQKITERIQGYQGNRLANIRPYDWYPDPRVTVRDFQRGEFCATRTEMGYNDALKRMQDGFYMEAALRRIREEDVHHTADSADYREQGSRQVELPTSQSFYIRGKDGQVSERGDNLSNIVLRLVECVVELIPQEWGLGNGDYPEKWLFTCTEDYRILLGATPLGAHHDRFPFAVIEYEPEAYSLVSRGIPEVSQPINDTLDWLLNSHLWNVRKAMNDQFIVDPTKVNLRDFENPLPGGAIRLSPLAYGQKISDVIMQLPVQDVTRGHLGDFAAVTEIGQRAIGVNDQLQGLVEQGGRRSATEVRTGASFGINRLKTTAEFFSAMGWAPLGQMLVQNSQQYYDGEKKFRLVGSLAQEAGNEFFTVAPETILGFYDFVPVDGTQPIDRIAQATLWQQLLGQLRNYPEIVGRYDMGRIFEWVAQLSGLKNIDQFRVQLVPDDQLGAEADAGNVIPLGGAAGGGGGGGNPSPLTPPLNIGLGGPRPA